MKRRKAATWKDVLVQLKITNALLREINESELAAMRDAWSDLAKIARELLVLRLRAVSQKPSARALHGDKP